MWCSQLGQTIQPSDVLFNLTKFSNTLSVGIADEAVILALRSFKADLDKDGKPYNVGAAMGFLKKTFGSTLNGATASKLAKDFT